MNNTIRRFTGKRLSAGRELYFWGFEWVKYYLNKCSLNIVVFRKNQAIYF